MKELTYENKIKKKFKDFGLGDVPERLMDFFIVERKKYRDQIKSEFKNRRIS